MNRSSAWSDISISNLLLQNALIPIFDHEPLTEYVIENAGFASLIEFRSKMGFKFQHVTYEEIKIDHS